LSEKKEGFIDMPHIFSVEIHEYLSTRIEQSEKKKKQAIDDKDESLQHHFEGELLELEEMRRYLTENIDLKTQKYY
jgi:hypothetical protein